MAKIFPSDWRSLEATGAAQREIETLAMLVKALPDVYAVYYGVHLEGKDSFRWRVRRGPSGVMTKAGPAHPMSGPARRVREVFRHGPGCRSCRRQACEARIGVPGGPDPFDTQIHVRHSYSGSACLEVARLVASSGLF